MGVGCEVRHRRQGGGGGRSSAEERRRLCILRGVRWMPWRPSSCAPPSAWGEEDDCYRAKLTQAAKRAMEHFRPRDDSTLQLNVMAKDSIRRRLLSMMLAIPSHAARKGAAGRGSGDVCPRQGGWRCVLMGSSPTAWRGGGDDRRSALSASQDSSRLTAWADKP